MYYPNQSEIYKILDFRNNSVLFEGSKDELIRMIAMKYRSSFEAYQEGYFSNFSKSPYYTYYTHSIYVNWLIGHSFCGELPSEDKYYQLKDSSGRILNMKDFEEESFAFYIKNKDKNSFFRFYIPPINRRKFKHQSKYRQEPVPYTSKYRGGSWWRKPHTKHIFLMYDNPEYKEFNRGTKKLVPSYWDDKIRRPQRSWKEQSKARHQWQRGNK